MTIPTNPRAVQLASGEPLPVRWAEPLDQPQQTQLKILLVEDNSVNQEVTRRQLKSLGYEADVVVNGQQAVEAITQVEYDLVLMDCQMPILDGYKAAKAIRELEITVLKHRPHRAVIIAMTANPLWQDQEKALAAGMDDYLKKPVHKEVLATMLKRWSQTLNSIDGPVDMAHRSYCSLTSNRDFLNLHIDWDHLHQLSDNSSEFEFELLQLFLEDSYNHVALLKQAIAIQDCQKIEQESHHIKGASANVGIRSMEEIAYQLEQHARQQHLDTAILLLTDLEQALGQVQAVIASGQLM